VSDLTQLLAELVAIDSVNPDLVPGGAGEGEIATFVAGWLERAGLEVSVDEALPGRPNVVGVARGSGGGRTLLLDAHSDTVGVDAMDSPHDPRVEGGRMYGRGAYDMKAGLAAAMVAAASVRGLGGDVVVAAVCDEEDAGAGTRALLQSGRRFDGAIVTEPTELGVAIAHKGFVGFEITTRGVAAHGSRPHLGEDAILKMAPVMAELKALDAELQSGVRHPLLGTASLHASLIEGGQEFSSYPERCMLTGEWRTLPGHEDAEAGLRAAIARSGVDAALRLLVTGHPLETPEDDPLVRLLHSHAGGDIVGVSYWADSAQIAAAGIPTALYGPIGDGAHAAVEWVDLDSVQRVCDVLVATASEFCVAS
jgi:acetylornithine deacetylase